MTKSSSYPLPTDNKTTALEDYDNGFSLYKSGHLQQAFQAFTRSTTLNPRHTNSHYYKGHACIKLIYRGHHTPKEFYINEAITSFSSFLQLNPSAEAHYHLGIALFIAGQNDKALDNFKQSLSLDDKYAQSYSGIGICLLRIDRKMHHTEIIKNFDQSIICKPDHALAYYYKGIALSNTNSPEAALDYFIKALEIQLDHFKEYEHTYFPSQFITVFQCCDKIVKNGQNTAKAHYAKGLAFFFKGNFHEALSNFDAAAALDTIFNKKLSAYRERIFDSTFDDFLNNISATININTGTKRPRSPSLEIDITDRSISTEARSPSSALSAIQSTQKMQRNDSHSPSPC